MSNEFVAALAWRTLFARRVSLCFFPGHKAVVIRVRLSKFFLEGVPFLAINECFLEGQASITIGIGGVEFCLCSTGPGNIPFFPGYDAVMILIGADKDQGNKVGARLRRAEFPIVIRVRFGEAIFRRGLICRLAGRKGGEQSRGQREVNERSSCHGRFGPVTNLAMTDLVRICGNRPARHETLV